ncbi:hypothetical protein ACLOJK_008144 [Asimina triloba]
MAHTDAIFGSMVRRVRVRGGNVKWRALGNYSWGSEAVTRKTRILDVVYNASNNELVRTQTSVKSAIVQVDAAPFEQWYLQHYGVDIGRVQGGATLCPMIRTHNLWSGVQLGLRLFSLVADDFRLQGQEGEGVAEEVKKGNHVVRKLEKRQQGHKLNPHIEEQFGDGSVASRSVVEWSPTAVYGSSCNSGKFVDQWSPVGGCKPTTVRTMEHHGASIVWRQIWANDWPWWTAAAAVVNHPVETMWRRWIFVDDEAQFVGADEGRRPVVVFQLAVEKKRSGDDGFCHRNRGWRRQWLLVR